MKPKPYSNSDTAEIESLNVFRRKVNSNYIKLDIKERDKFPNIDGYAEIVTVEQIPIGKIEVQIKTIRNGDANYYIDSSLFSYAETTTLPVILILVNRTSNLVFWIRISSNIGKLTKGNNVKVEIKNLDTIDEYSSYIQKWISIVQEYRKRIKEHPILQELLEANQYTKPIDGLSKDKLKYLQNYVDFLNSMLDKEYKIVKDVIFPGIWKIGIAVISFDSSLAYGIFGIKYGESDLLIKSLDKTKFDFHQRGNIRTLHHTFKIPEDPSQLAKSRIQSYINDFLEAKAFPVVLTEFANEYIFAVVNKYFFAFGFKEEQDSYEISKVKIGFENYFFKWVYLASKKINYPEHLDHIDISMIEFFTNENIKINISEELLESNDPVPPYLFKTSEFTIPQFIEALEILQRESILCAMRITPKHDFSKFKNNKSHWIWDKYTEEEIKTKIRIEYVHAYKLFEEYVYQTGLPHQHANFPKSEESILIAPMLNITNSNPYIGVQYIRLNQKYENNFERYQFIELDDATLQNTFESRSKIEINEKQYLVSASGWSIDIPIFEMMPYREFVFKKLKDLTNKHLSQGHSA